MKLAVRNEYINLENVESELTNIRHLLFLHSDYFMWSKEKVEKEPYILTCRYDEHNSLIMAIINVLDNAQELLTIARENYIHIPYPEPN